MNASMEYTTSDNSTVDVDWLEEASEIYWPGLCGNNGRQWAIWDHNLTLNTTTPDMPLCLQHVILMWIPCFFLFLASPFRLLYLSTLPTIHPMFQLSKLCIAKMCIPMLLVALVVVVLGRAIGRMDLDALPAAVVVSPVLALVALILAMLIVHTEYRKGRHTSGVMLIFWFLTFVAGMLKIHSFVLRSSREGGVEDVFGLTVFCLAFALVVAQLLLTALADVEAARTDHAANKSGSYNVKNNGANDTIVLQPSFDHGEKLKDCPELTTPYLLRVTFLWISKLVLHGYKNALDFGDLWSVRPNDRSSFTHQKFDWAWTSETNRLKKSLHVPTTDSNNADHALPDYTAVPSHENDPTVSNAGAAPCPSSPSLWKVFFKAYGVQYGISSMYKLIYDALSVVQPLLLGALIRFIMDPSMHRWKGVCLAMMIFTVAWIRSLCNNIWTHTAILVGMRIRTMISAAVYRKALRLSSAGKTKYTTGEIVNMVAVDANKLFEVFQNLNFLWSTPLILAVSLGLLWRLLGVATLAGLGMVVLILPLNFAFARYSRILQIANMKHKDARLKLLNEVLNGIKVLKLYAWEESFRQKVGDIRETEVGILTKAAVVDAFAFVTWFMSPFMISLASFGVFVAASEDNVLNAHTAFVSLALIYLMHGPILLTSIMIGQLIHAVVATKRLQQFLCSEEVDDSFVSEPDVGSDDVIVIENATLTWDKDLTPVLKDVSIRVREGSMVAVVGVVGCGKTSLVSALLGELHCLSGKVKIKGSVSYVPQQAWVLNNTVRDNILFGGQFSSDFYKQCIESCALGPDLAILPAGDKTEIGDKGVNLSGGQKQRLSLARAMYQNTSVYLFDDPLSAVDSHVGKHIFTKVIGKNGYLNGRTRLLVTHNLTYLPKMDSIVVLGEDGRIADQGTYDELLSRSGAFSTFLQNYMLTGGADELLGDGDDDEDEDAKRIRADVMRQLSTSSAASILNRGVSVERIRTNSLSKHKSVEDLGEVKKQAKEVAKQKAQKKQESVESGDISLQVYSKYFRSFGTPACVLLFGSYLLYMAALAGGSVWLQVWSDSLDNNLSLAADQEYSRYNLGIYAVFGVAQSLFLLLSTFALALGSLKSSYQLHSQMLLCLVRSPMSFFDVTPLGRVINRFSKDIDQLDVYLPWVMRIWMATFSAVATTVALVCYCMPIFFVPLVPICILYYVLQRFYIRTTRQLKRLEAVSRSPILSLIGESVNGTSSIRAYNRRDQFVRLADALIDTNTTVVYPNLISFRWLQFILDQVGIFAVLFISLYSVFTRDVSSGGLVGLAVSFSLRATSVLCFVVRMSCDVESSIVSAERIMEYSELTVEADLDIEETRPQNDWPKGEVEIENYCVRYRPELDMVLKNLNLHIKAGEKLGVVGRTGSGKSTLTLALFRILEPVSGTIRIDGLDITKLGLHQLRSKITIIPQDPVLFCGSLRENLDPFGVSSDEQLWTALEQSQLKEYFKNQAGQLDFKCSEGGSNLSAGQKQLVCLARALLRKTNIIVLDEATAAVDVETDEFIQAAIRTEFSNATVIIIAHRLNTIMDCDRVLVLDQGSVLELDSPSVLLGNDQTTFYSMASDAGLV